LSFAVSSTSGNQIEAEVALLSDFKGLPSNSSRAEGQNASTASVHSSTSMRARCCFPAAD